MNNGNTICAISTPPGTGAVSIIRISGRYSAEIVDRYFIPKKKGCPVACQKPATMQLGTIVNGNYILDEVLVCRFVAPFSYTGEDIIEIYCHGSVFIQSEIMRLLIDGGAKLAQPGEFTLRAFINGKLDLSQAEAVADLISSNSKAAHDIAIDQMKGGFSSRIKGLRKKLVDFSSLIELELDFSEEDVEFAKRDELMRLLWEMTSEIKSMADSFSVGNVIKNGVPVAIIGKPNVGKSTLLNLLLNEDRALVSDIPGTTRDAIEDVMVINGITFRFIDTAGLRDAEDHVENLGIEKTWEKIEQAKVILYIFDISSTTLDEIRQTVDELGLNQDEKTKKLILIGNKIDKLIEIPKGFREFVELETIFISAKRKENIDLINESLVKFVMDEKISEGTIITNLRHYEALKDSLAAIEATRVAISAGISSDLVAEHIREALHHLGHITGEITSDEVLGNIFGKFCIGK